MNLTISGGVVTESTGGGGASLGAVAVGVDGGDSCESSKRGLVGGVENSDPGLSGSSELGVSGGKVTETVRLPDLPLTGGGRADDIFGAEEGRGMHRGWRRS
ncbi:unnamed protein product [Urochloa humidicola]